METYRQTEGMTIMQRGGPAGVTVVITESPDGAPPRWTISYFPATRFGKGAVAFTDDSDTAPIPDELGDVLMWAKRRWDEYRHEHKAA
jgi:hypothetical protein